jgi:hypothetical protein
MGDCLARTPHFAYRLSVASWDDVRRIALGLPEVAERVSRGLLEWRVREKVFVWERPLRKGDLAALGELAPTGSILGARVADESEKAAWLAEQSGLYFTTPHFDGYPAILVSLDDIAVADLQRVVVEAWLARAPRRLAEEFLR